MKLSHSGSYPENKSKFLRSKITILCLFCFINILTSQQTDIEKYTAGREDRMKWFKEARFGMFIHWGPYSLLAGEWKNERIRGLGEWIMYNAKIPVKDYEEVAKQFNPVKFNAADWVALAKDAGVKYMVITAKHCDGFAMYPSSASKYNIHDWTPYKNDPLKALETSCLESGIKFGFYYSQWWDWHEPDATGKDNTWDFPDTKNKQPDKYLQSKAIPQVKELVTRYHPDIIWFDVPCDGNSCISEQQGFEFLKTIRTNLPNCIINDRISSNRVNEGSVYKASKDLGDYTTPEQFIPGGKGNNFEVCMTLNKTWGYKYYDNDWKSPETIVRNLTDIVSKGGNYLLNIGPTAEGLIPEPTIRILQEVGKWMSANGESIYGTEASPFGSISFNGRCTQKPGKLYFHVFDWPKIDELTIPEIKNKITRIYLLSDPGKTAMKYSKPNGKEAIIQLNTIHIPVSYLNEYNNVIVVEYEGKPEISNNKKVVDLSYPTTFNMSDALLSGKNLKYSFNELWNENRGYHLTGWNSTEDEIKWEFKTIRPGNYDLFITYGAPSGCEENEYDLYINQQKFSSKVVDTGGWYQFITYRLGTISLNANDEFHINIKSGKTGECSLMNLKSITLLPIIK